MLTQPLPPVLDAAGVAALLSCSERTAEDNARSGNFPAVKFGEGWIFPTEALLQAVNRIAVEQATARVKAKEAPAPAAVLQDKPARRKGPPDLTLLSQPGR